MNQQNRSLRAVSLIEILILIALLGVVAALIIPQAGSLASAQLVSAGRLLAADLNLARTESLSHGEDYRVVVFEPDANRYYIASVLDPDTPITNKASRLAYETEFGTGRAANLTGVSIQSLSMGDDPDATHAELGFRLYGQLDQPTDATVTLACGNRTLTLTVHASTGEVTVGELK